MQYREEVRDLFTVDDSYVLAHCISSDFVMGAGIAAQFTKRGVKRTLMRTYSQVWYGKGYCFPCAMGEYTVCNLVTKEKFYHKPTYETLKDSLINMRELLDERKSFKGVPTKIAMPLIGCGLDGLKWERVKIIITEVFKNTDYDILVCKLR